MYFSMTVYERIHFDMNMMDTVGPCSNNRYEYKMMYKQQTDNEWQIDETSVKYSLWRFSHIIAELCSNIHFQDQTRRDL